MRYIIVISYRGFQERLTNLQEELSRGVNEVARLRDTLSSLEEELKVCKNNAKTKVSDLEYRITQVEVRHVYLTLLLLRPFPYLGSAHRVFNLEVLRSCASSFCTRFSSFMSLLVTSLHLSFSLTIFRRPPMPSSMFSLLHLLHYICFSNAVN